MRNNALVHLAPALALLSPLLGHDARAAVPGGIDVICDVDRRAFRSAATGESTVTFRLYDSEVGGSQVGLDYVVPMADLIVEKVKAESRYDSVKRRPYGRIEATIGNDANPVDLGTGEAWLDVTIGSATLTCDEGKRVSVPPVSPPARKRVQSVAFAREAEHSETCETCSTAPSLPDFGVGVRIPNGTISLSDGASLVLPFSIEDWDPSNMHDGGDPTALVAPVAGRYLVTATARFSANPTGIREIYIKAAHAMDSETLGQVIAAATPIQDTILTTSTIANMGIGEVITITVTNGNSGATLNLLDLRATMQKIN
jgi:hypothetical protein